MPEGDTLFRTAARLRPYLQQQRIIAAAAKSQVIDAGSLRGSVVQLVEARGKHLLMHLDDRRTLHTHLGMHGVWHVYRPGQTWRKPATRAKLSLETEEAVCVCFSPKAVELLSEAELRRHRFISRLGPDLLGGQLDRTEVLRRFRIHNAVPIGQAVMNQTIVCGIGNVYKSEVLFLTHTNPFTRVGELSDEQIWTIVDEAVRLMSLNLEGQPRRTRFALDRQRSWVYGRSGQRCFVCGETIRLRRQGDLGRTTCWCPNCQPAVPGGAPGRPTERTRRKEMIS